MFRNPMILKWSMIVLPEEAESDEGKVNAMIEARASETLYAQKLIEFLDKAEVGDRIEFAPNTKRDYTFSIYGCVYGRADGKFADGSEIATSGVLSITRVDNDTRGALYAVQTHNTVYYIYGRESIELIRFKANRF